MTTAKEHERHSLKSEKREIDTFFKMSRRLYDDSVLQCSELYDIAARLTDHFRNITGAAVVADSRIIKILRYSGIPSLSQMKLGQLLGLDSTASLEDRVAASGKALSIVKKHADEIAKLASDSLDRQRFLWLNTKLTHEQLSLARLYAKRWTSSLIADQNSATAFRNWRKELQEKSIASALVAAGYTEVETRKVVVRPSDILVGQFSRECRVRGRSIQKADFAVRMKKKGKLLLLEAKAVGVKIDAFKRIKECREKADDWKSAFGNQVACGAVLAGFIPATEVASLVDNDVEVFWEHDLVSLTEFVR